MQGVARMSSPEKHGTTEVWLVRVSGHVQGVGYRDACERRARTLGITGWVRNRRDGSVELMLQGSSKPLADMCHWLRHGISAARVADLEITVVQPPLPHFDHFDRLPTL
jgi:acylphosphatase